MMQPLPPGSTIGILGGGQLGRMMALAAAELDVCHLSRIETERSRVATGKVQIEVTTNARGVIRRSVSEEKEVPTRGVVLNTRRCAHTCQGSRGTGDAGRRRDATCRIRSQTVEVGWVGTE